MWPEGCGQLRRPPLSRRLQPTIRDPLRGVAFCLGPRRAIGQGRGTGQGAVQLEHGDLASRQHQAITAAVALVAPDQPQPPQLPQNHREVVRGAVKLARDAPRLQGPLRIDALQRADQHVAVPEAAAQIA